MTRLPFLAAVCLLGASRATAADALSAKTYPKDAVRDIVVETESGRVSLRASADGATAVDVSPAAAPGDDCRITRDLRGGVLRLTARAAKSTLGPRKTCSAGFDVAGSARTIRVRSGSGAVRLGMPCRKAEIRTGSGAVALDGATGSLVLRSGGGAVEGSASGRVEVETGSGDIRLTGLNGLVAARSGSGAVSLDWNRAPDSGEITVNTGTGGLQAWFPAESSLKTVLRSASGSTRSDFNDARSKLTLTFHSGAGSATVKRKP
jgi:hypothetical protein